MRVSLEQLSVQFDSYPWGGWGNPPVLSDGDKGPRGGSEQTRGLQRAVNPEQASKVRSRPPTRQLRGEGRSVSGKQPTIAPGTGAGVMGAAREEGSLGNVGDPEREAGSRLATARPVPVPPGVGEAHGTEETGESPAEGRGLASGTLSERARVRRLAQACTLQPRSGAFRGSLTVGRSMDTCASGATRASRCSLSTSIERTRSYAGLIATPVGELDAGKPHVQFDERR